MDAGGVRKGTMSQARKKAPGAVSPAKADAKGKAPETARENGETATCMHCRYERPAADARRHICGYPWPWMEEKK